MHMGTIGSRDRELIGLIKGTVTQSFFICLLPLHANYIKRLYDSKGNCCTSEQRVSDITFGYFHQLFKPSVSTDQDIEEMLLLVLVL